MMNFFGSVSLDSVLMKSMSFNINDDIKAENGRVAINHEIVLMNPKDMEQESIEFVKLMVSLDLDGLDTNDNSFFTLKNTYEAYFNVINNKHFFTSKIKERSHFCFLLIYPYIVEDIQQTLKRAGIEGVELALSASPEDMVREEL